MSLSDNPITSLPRYSRAELEQENPEEHRLRFTMWAIAISATLSKCGSVANLTTSFWYPSNRLGVTRITWVA